MISAKTAYNITNSSKIVHDNVEKCLELCDKEVTQAAKAGLSMIECKLYLVQLAETVYNEVIVKLENILLDLGFEVEMRSDSVILKWGKDDPS